MKYSLPARNKTTFETFILDIPEQKEKFDKEYEEFLLSESDLEKKGVSDIPEEATSQVRADKDLKEQTAQLLSILPDEDLILVHELVKKLIIAWDPDFTKVTPSEKEIIDNAYKDMRVGELFADEEVWD